MASHTPAERDADDVASVVLPQRPGPRPRTTPATPHVQLDQPAPPSVQADVWQQMTGLEGVRAGRSGISAPSSRALHLDPSLASGPPDAFLVGTEFAHLHGDGSGSLHLTLPEKRAAEAISKAWAELHPIVLLAMRRPTLLLLYGPRDEEELVIVWRLLEESYAYARGLRSGPTV